MIQAKLSQIAKVISAKMIGNDCKFSGVSTDSRTIMEKQLFYAIKGPKFDGHEFIQQLVAKNIKACVVEKPVKQNISQLIVENSREALGKLAKWWRQQFALPVLALTGSSGKTTTKTMLTSILKQKYHVLAPQGTFNNDIGLPLTLFNLSAQHEMIVLEIGGNHFGEIAYLSQIAEPDAAAILNIGLAHIEGFGGNLAGVMHAKSEIFAGLKSGGTAVLNRDEAFFADLKANLLTQNIITFGKHKNAEVRAENISFDQDDKPQFDLLIANHKRHIKLTTIGEHNVMNALAACALALTQEIDIDTMKQGLETTEVVGKRLCLYKGIKGSQIIDDSYNAIPQAVMNALQILARRPGKKIFVFGGMAELGEMVASIHEEVGAFAKKLKIDRLLAIGKFSHLTIEKFGAGGILFETKAELIEYLKTLLDAQTTVLIKGSRGSRMEEVVQVIQSE